MTSRRRDHAGARILYGWMAVLALGGGVLLLDLTPLAELQLLDRGYAWSRRIGHTPVKDDIAIVGVDEATLAQFAEPVALWHRYLGTILTGLAAADPAAIGLDIELPERSYDFVRPGGDRALMQGLIAARAVPFVIARGVDQNGRIKPIHAPFLAAVGVSGSGLASWPLDRDGRVRRFDEHLGENGASVATLAGALARRLGHDPRAGLIDFSRGDKFDYVPAHEVYAWALGADRERLRERFAGRIVLMGSVLAFTDRHALPVALASWEQDLRAPGILIHAQALRTLLGHGAIVPAPPYVVALLIVAASLLWFAFARQSVGWGLLAAFVALLLCAWMLLLRTGVHLPVAAPLAAALIAAGTRIGHEAWYQRMERTRLRRAFEGYVSPNVLERILRGDLDSEIGSGRRMLCVLFADIRDFTRLCERIEPERAVGMLNAYFERMTRAIHEHQGTVDNFRGDGLMCFFGAPLATAEPCRDGLAAARAMLGELAELNRELAQLGLPAIEIGISLAYGEAVVGRIGAGARHDYTAIGDVANVSARLEGYTKALGYTLIAGESVLAALGRTDGFDDLGTRELRGHAPMRVFGWPARATSRSDHPSNELTRAVHA